MEVIDKNEYISKIEVVRILQKAYAEGRIKAKDGLSSVLDDIQNADVQPVDRWISVDEALPIYDGLVLAVDKNNTIRLGIYTDLGWTSQFGNPMVAHITHWQPLPEPPKDGDTNG